MNRLGFKAFFILKNRRICNYLRIKRLFGLHGNWVTRWQPFLFQSSLLFCISTNDELKNIAQVEHSRHRCFDNFIVNLLGAIAAYCCFPKKPCINVERTLNNQLTLFWIRRTHVKLIRMRSQMQKVAMDFFHNEEKPSDFLMQVFLNSLDDMNILLGN